MRIAFRIFPIQSSGPTPGERLLENYVVQLWRHRCEGKFAEPDFVAHEWHRAAYTSEKSEGSVFIAIARKYGH